MLLLAGATLTEEWVELMGNDAVRWTINLGIGALFALVVWLLGMTPVAQKIPPAGRKFFPPIGAAAGVVLALFVAHYVPGVVVLELVGTLGGGGLGSHVVHKIAENSGHAERTRAALAAMKKRPPA